MNPTTSSLSTVNVIERCAPGNITIRSFPDDREGNLAAEALFARIAREVDRNAEGLPTYTDSDIEDALSGGYIDDGAGWELYLVHSEV